MRKALAHRAGLANGNLLPRGCVNAAGYQETIMANSNSFQTDQYVTWKWGNGTASGQIKERFERDVKRTLKGSEVTRKGSADDPAYLIKQEDGDGIDDLDGAIIVALESNDNSGFFVCGGVGYFGGVGGICGANNPNDIYLYLGAGTPGPTLNLGIATDTTAYLGDFSGSYVSPTGTGAGLSGDLQNSTIMFGTPGASITFGISVVDSANAIVSIYNNFENTFAGGFVDQYYPSGNSYENVVEQ